MWNGCVTLARLMSSSHTLTTTTINRLSASHITAYIQHRHCLDCLSASRLGVSVHTHSYRILSLRLLCLLPFSP